MTDRRLLRVLALITIASIVITHLVAWVRGAEAHSLAITASALITATILYFGWRLQPGKHTAGESKSPWVPCCQRPNVYWNVDDGAYVCSSCYQRPVRA